MSSQAQSVISTYMQHCLFEKQSRKDVEEKDGNNDTNSSCYDRTDEIIKDKKDITYNESSTDAPDTTKNDFKTIEDNVSISSKSSNLTTPSPLSISPKHSDEANNFETEAETENKTLHPFFEKV